MGVVAKRSSMTFFSNGEDHYSHRVRIVLAEKGVTVDVLDTDPEHLPEDVTTLNPYSSLPTLLDRELVLFEPNIMMEYLDERFPHPPLLPVYPVARAESRQLMHRIQRDWCKHVDLILANKNSDEAEQSRQILTDSLVSIAPIFSERPYFMSDEFTLVDCCTAPILWRLPALGIELPEKPAKHLLKYMGRLFERESFRASLSEAEKEIRA
ncbi:stringent starvation protein A [Pokkaliibacter plantistimulans]|uniref:Stringent starvation protein A n=2 Tax=Pseudomonadota TaxID=1224 RepID=A0ABX5M2E0_9GAMM|nr:MULTISPECIES: glutathione S-transferase N-terminal domain-containing protein [Pokkaliibacter]MDH2431639.1 glutathione S-transferase N-terminal domain-containing protein [Pokkaliibacter sp. MBI-7]PPC74793.1 stringent starvation protein A [Pokkaliibacter plantistimulans]PXF31746.1 stringent starvation protein A [Pokkaliibacter plantistimulans]